MTWGQEDCSPTNPDLADILGDTDFHFDNVYVFGFSWIPNFQNSRFLDFQIPGLPDFQIPGLPDFQIPGFPDSWILEPGSWLWLAAARGGHQSPDLGGFWTALPDHRIQEIQGTRQYRENPISASLFWGISTLLLQYSLRRTSCHVTSHRPFLQAWLAVQP